MANIVIFRDVAGVSPNELDDIPMGQLAVIDEFPANFLPVVLISAPRSIVKLDTLLLVEPFSLESKPSQPAREPRIDV